MLLFLCTQLVPFCGLLLCCKIVLVPYLELCSCAVQLKTIGIVYLHRLSTRSTGHRAARIMLGCDIKFSPAAEQRLGPW